MVNVLGSMTTHNKLARGLAWACTWMVLAAAVLTGACSGDSEPRLLDGANRGEPEAERLRKLQFVRIIDIGTSSPTVIEKPPPELTGPLHDMCMTELETRELYSLINSNDCALNLLVIRGQICMANYLAEIATIRAEPFVIQTAEPGQTNYRNWQIPAQSTATNSALMRLAAKRSQDATFWAENWLRELASGTATYCTTTKAAVRADGATIRVQLANSYAESYHLYRELTDKAVEFTVAVADAQRSSTPTLETAANRSISGEQLSRSHAAHLLLGGKSGLKGSFENAFCTSPELTPQARQALSLMREAGIAPNDVLAIPGSGVTSSNLSPTGEVSITDLMDAETSRLSSGSIRLRLQELWGYAIASPLKNSFALNDSDFVEARQYLAREIQAFSRSKTAVVQPPALTNNRIPNLTANRYAATVTEPQLPPGEYYGALARFGSEVTGSTFSVSSLPFFSATGHADEPQVTGYIDAAISRAGDLSRNASLPLDVRAPLSQLLQTASNDYLARIVFIRGPTTGNTASVYVYGFGINDGLRVVVGEDALRCYVNNTVEGANCASSYPNAFVNTTLAGSAPWGAFTKGAQSVVTAPSSAEHGVYVLRPRPGIVPGLPGANPANASYGDYEALAGVVMNFATLSNGSYFVVPVVPEVSRRAAAILAPSPKWCTHPATECVDGEPAFDERMPLENELVDDGDGVENSWRHYLDQAKQAAQEADLLGDAVIQNGLEVDQRGEELELRREQRRLQAEADTEELQSICGTAVDSDRLLEIFGGTATSTTCTTDSNCTGGMPCIAGFCTQNFSSVLTTCTSNANCGTGTCTNGRCTCTDNTGCSSDSRCIAGQCIRDIEKVATNTTDPDQAALNRLKECIGTSTVYDLATLGNVDVCVWKDAQGRYCSRAAVNGKSQYSCPAEMKDGSCDFSDFGFASSSDMPSGSTIATITNHLGYFDTEEPTTGNADSSIGQLCKDFRALRRQPADDAKLRGIASSNIFHPQTLGLLAGRLGWEARYNNYSAILVDSTPLYTTGDVFQGGTALGTWPCGTQTTNARRADCGTGDPSLFCDQVDCRSTYNVRTPMNERMMQAVLGINALAFMGDIQLTQPVDVSAEGDWLETWRQTTQYAALVNIFSSAGDNQYHIFSTEPNADLLYVVAGTARSVWDGGWHFITTKVDKEYSFSLALQGMSTYMQGTGPIYQALAGTLSNPSNYRVRDDNGFAQEQDLFQAPAHSAHDYETPRETLPPYDFNLRSLLDGLELACELQARSDANCDIANAPNGTNLSDLTAANDFLQCTARSIQQQSANMVFANVPSAAAGALTQTGAAGSYPAVGGEYGEELAKLRAAMVELHGIGPLIAAEISQLGYDLKEVQTQLELNSVQSQIGDLQFMSTVASQLAACASTFGVMEAFSLAPAATCANSLAQINFAGQIKELMHRQEDLEDDLAINRFSQQFAVRAQNLQGFANQITEQSEAINGALANLENLRLRALTAIGRALRTSSFAAQNEPNISSAMLTRYATSKRRYEAARKNAQKISFLAKRAIEQRLGMHLSAMRDDLPLVEAPALWESEICTSSGLDYSKFREPLSGDTTSLDTATNLAQNFSDAYVGEYVRKLENVVESYRLVNGFHEGSDTAVISVRDDVQNVRAFCDSRVDNLLYEAGQLDALVTTDTKGWGPVGCLTQVQDANWEPTPLDITNLDTWFRSDHPNIVLQSGTELTTREIKTAPLKGSWNSTSGMNRGLWQQNNTAYQPSQRIFAEGLAPLFGSTDTLISDQAASRYSYLHGSAGATVAVVYRPTGSAPTNYLVRTTGGATTNVGFLLRYDNSQFKVWIANGGASYWYAVSTGTYAANQTYRIVVRFNGTGLQVRVNGVVATSGTPTGSPSTAAPAATLSVGASGSTYSVNGYVPEVLLYNRYLGDTEVTTLETYLNRWQLAQETTAVAGEERLVENCVTALPKSSGLAAVQTSDFSSVRTYDVQFGDGTADCRNSIACGYDPHKSALVQRVLLPPGRYQLSYSGENQLGNFPLVTACNPPTTDTQAECQTPVVVNSLSSFCQTLPSGWRRCSSNFDVSEEQVLEVGFGQTGWGRGGNPSLEGNALYPRLLTRGFAAIMLEDISGISSAETTPRAFANTSQTLTERLPLCEDTDGTEFRRTRWRRHCVQLCPDGYASQCVDANAQTYCYRETQFSINQRDIESGRILNQSGFARGNYNYRIESIGLNFVGSGIRDCSESDLPTTCYSAGFIPYSVQHQGPYMVRNHMGQDFEAALFTGTIEHARGLAAERYVTNPLSSSDAELIEQYLRSEFQGRPLDGTFVLRVWEEEGVNFDGIDDVQVVLKYRYWTRFD